MAVVDTNAVRSPVLSSPTMGAAVVRSGNQQQATPPMSVEQVQARTEQKVSARDVQKAVHQANMALPGSNEAIAFGYEEKLGQLYVQVTDKKSGEVIREIPSKEFLQHRVFMREMIGLLLDKQA